MMKKLDILVLKFFVSILLFLILGILSKSSTFYYNKIHYYLYEQSFNFDSIYSFYNKYLGALSIYDINSNTNKVFNERFRYHSIEEFGKGIKVFVDKNQLISSLNNGKVIFIGNKDDYDNVIIINTKDVNVWYCNICNTSLKMYDSLKKGTYIGESCQDYIYIIYEKDGNYLNYRDYFKV